MKRIAIALLAAVLLMSAAMAEQVLPSNTCFSPGLVRMSEIMAQGAGVTATAEFTADDVLYIKDLSIFEDMLDGAVFTYAGKPGFDSLTIVREGEKLCDLALYDDAENGVAVMRVNGETMALDSSIFESEAMLGFMQAEEFLNGTPILERVPLEAIAEWIEWFGAGDELVPGYMLNEPFAVERTMSDDGERLTRIDIDATMTDAQGETWTVSGYLRQPAGTQPKDTFKIKVRRDDKNYVEIEYSAQRKNEIARRDRQGRTTVRSQIVAEAKVGGVGISAKLIVNAVNNWITDGEGGPLEETITLNTTIGFTDRRRDAVKAFKNDLAVKMRHEIELSSLPGIEEISLTDEASIEATVSSAGLLGGTMNMSVTAGTGLLESVDVTPPQTDGQDLTAQDVEDALGGAVRDMSAAYHAQQAGNEEYIEKITP